MILFPGSDKFDNDCNTIFNTNMPKEYASADISPDGCHENPRLAKVSRWTTDEWIDALALNTKTPDGSHVILRFAYDQEMIAVEFPNAAPRGMTYTGVPPRFKDPTTMGAGETYILHRKVERGDMIHFVQVQEPSIFFCFETEEETTDVDAYRKVYVCGKELQDKISNQMRNNELTQHRNGIRKKMRTLAGNDRITQTPSEGIIPPALQEKARRWLPYASHRIDADRLRNCRSKKELFQLLENEDVKIPEGIAPKDTQKFFKAVQALLAT